jgi:hypothetical protein
MLHAGYNCWNSWNGSMPLSWWCPFNLAQKKSRTRQLYGTVLLILHSTHRVISLDSSFYRKFVCTLRVSEADALLRNQTPLLYISALVSLFERYKYIYIIHTTSIPLQRIFHLCIPRKGIARPQSQFPHSCVCERFIWSACLFCGRKICGPIVEIYESLTDTWMWKLGLRPLNFFGYYLFQILVLVSLQCIFVLCSPIGKWRRKTSKNTVILV